MATQSDIVAVSTTPVKLAPGTWAAGGGYQSGTLRPTNGRITVGKSSATASAGATLDYANGDSLDFSDFKPGDEIWGVAASGTVNVERVLTGDLQ